MSKVFVFFFIFGGGGKREKTRRKNLTKTKKTEIAGVYLAEFRNHGTPRELMVTVQGESTEE